MLNRFLKHLLAYIINQMFVVGYCPLDIKVSIVKPIYKNGDKMLDTNYRPISLITNFAKVYEMLLKTRLCNFIEKFKIPSDNQFGFTEVKSTQDAIAELTKKIYHSLDKSKPSLCVFIDLAKAFDTVSHKHRSRTQNKLLRLLTSTNSDRYITIAELHRKAKISMMRDFIIETTQIFLTSRAQ